MVFLYENNINDKIPLTNNYLIQQRKIHSSNKIDKYKDIIIKYVNNNEGCILTLSLHIIQ